MGCWLPVMPEYLETALANGKVLKWTYQFDWTGDGVMVVKDGEAVPIHGYGTEWTYDSTNHWHECSCGSNDTAPDSIWNRGRCSAIQNK